MKINEIIRSKRQEKKLTQDSLAKLLGVSSSAVSKWEKGESMPDVTLLAPIARALSIDLNTLFSFEEELDTERIANLLNELASMYYEEGFERAYDEATKYLNEYPGSAELRLNIAMLVDGFLAMDGRFEERSSMLLEHYVIVSRCSDVKLAAQAKGILVSHYIGDEKYDDAQNLIDELAELPSADCKQLRANLERARGDVEASKKLYEELALEKGSELIGNMLSLVDLAVSGKDYDRAISLVDIIGNIADSCGMWDLSADMMKLDIFAATGDMDSALRAVKQILFGDYNTSMEKSKNIFTSVDWKEPDDNFARSMKGVVVRMLLTDDRLKPLLSDSEVDVFVKEFFAKRGEADA